jgi:D-xylose transport system substrate-binding protein
MTVYKAIKKEADAAAELAIALAKGEEPTAETTPIDNGTKEVPSVLETPVAVNKDNISEYLGEPDFPTKEDICTGKFAAQCEELGL